MLAERVNIDAFFGRAEALSRRVAPKDLGDTPLYIVPQSRVPGELGGKSISGGFTEPCLDLYLKDVIGPAWRGRGGCMVVNDTDFGEQMDADDMELAIAATVLHELAHILERPAIYRDRRGDDPQRLQFEALVMGHAVAGEPVVDMAADAAAQPFDGHGASFIRVATHLRYRAELAGTLVPVYCYCAGNMYGLSHPNRYRKAIGDEPARLADRRIREILDTPYPKAFWRLWSTDVAHWLSDGKPQIGKESIPMSIATLIERIVGKQRERQAADFRDVVVWVADGKEPDPDFVSQALRDADKSLDDLQKAVELYQTRREMRKEWETVPRLMAQRQELEQQLSEADRELELAESKHYATVHPICSDLERLKEAIQEGEKAKSELLDTCSDQILLDKLADLQIRLSKRREEAADLRSRIDNLRSWVKNDRAEAVQQEMIVDGDAKTYLARAKEHERKVVEREAQLTKINKIVSSLEREETAICEQMLVP